MAVRPPRTFRAPTGYAAGGVTYRPRIFKAPTGYAPGNVEYTGPNRGTALAPPGSIGVPGTTPDYRTALEGDPTYVAGMSDLDTAYGQTDLQTKEAMRRAIVEAGIVPTGYAGTDIDQATIEQARANPFSAAALAARARTQGSATLAQNLAAGGTLRSGAAILGQNRLQRGYEQGLSTLGSTLMDKLAGFEGTRTTAFSERAKAKSDLLQKIADRLQKDPRYQQPAGKATASLDRASGLYKTPDGRWYDRTGKRVAAPGAA